MTIKSPKTEKIIKSSRELFYSQWLFMVKYSCVNFLIFQGVVVIS